MLNGSMDKLSWAVLQTVTYSDIFDYPLTTGEIHRFLIGTRATPEEVAAALQDVSVTRTGDYFTLPGREGIRRIRMEREKRSRELLPAAIRYGRILGTFPFVRMVALTGSLAVLNITRDADFDYMLVTQPGRVWTARAFAVLFNRMIRKFGHTICPNLIVSENALEWPLHDLYSARELCQMIPISGLAMYRRLLKANEWAKDILPNAFATVESRQDEASTLQRVLELALHSKLGDHFERWEMNRKIARFSRQAGFGEETIFSAEVCQGNFHHHGKWTRERFEERLFALEAIRGGDLPIPSPRTPTGANRPSALAAVPGGDIPIKTNRL